MIKCIRCKSINIISHPTYKVEVEEDNYQDIPVIECLDCTAISYKWGSSTYFEFYPGDIKLNNMEAVNSQVEANKTGGKIL